MATSRSTAVPEHPLLELAWESAADASRFLRDERPAALEVESKSTATDAVTVMDRGAEERIVASLLAQRPDDAVLGEEGGERAGASGLRWVIDPLDGTVNYIYDLPAWAVSVAAQDEHGSVVGVVIAPPLSLAWVAVRGQGAFELALDPVIGPLPGHGRRLSVGRVPDLSRALVATGFGYDAGRRARQGAVVAALLPQVRDIRRIGAATVDQCFVASGRCEAFFEKGLHPWDMAAASLVAQEAGAVVRGIAGGRWEEGLLVCVPELEGPLDDLLTRAGAHLA